jgi:TldD protein
VFNFLLWSGWEGGALLKDLLQLAVDVLESKKVTYGDARIGINRWQNLFTRNQMVTNISDDASEGIGIRVSVDGGWGFSSTCTLERESVITAVNRAIRIAKSSAVMGGNGFKFAHEEPHTVEWQIPYEIDPFNVPVVEKVNFLKDINHRLAKNPLIKQAISTLRFSREQKLFMNTQGTYSNQILMRVSGEFTATAVGPEGFETRSFSVIPLNTGYEHIMSLPLDGEIERISTEAVEKLKSKDCPECVTNLILMPSHTALTIHETIGHATELDRVMGWEADMAGTSFATTDKLGCLQYGSKIFNVIADRTMKKGRASVPIDDDGVETGKWNIIKDGILSGYATTRSTAHFIGETRSRGCSYADSWQSLPILRMPNVSIEPGPVGSPTLEELISDTGDGVLVDGTGSFSIDHQRINFQFGGDCARRIRNGKVGEILRRFTYHSHNPEFWNSVDAICCEQEWQPQGVINCGKGQPLQIAQLTHGSAPLRLRNIMIGRARI